MIKQKAYLHPGNLDFDHLNNLNIGFGVFTLDLYLFQLIVLLKADFNFSSSFALSWYQTKSD